MLIRSILLFNQHFRPALLPEKGLTLEGRFCRLEPLNKDIHGIHLFEACTPPDALHRFQYLLADAPKDIDEV